MKRYLLQQPSRLDSAVLVKLGQWIALQGEKLMPPISELYKTDTAKAETVLSKQIEIIRQYLNRNLPKLNHNRLVHEAMQALLQLYKTTVQTVRHKSLTRESAIHLVVRRMVETLFNKNLTFVLLDSELFQASFARKSTMLTGLLHLNINLPPSSERDIIQLLKELHNLRSLSMAFNCTHNILLCVAKNCKLIEELDICYSAVHDNSIDLLTQLHHLRSVNLKGTSVSLKGTNTLLLNCKNIENTGSDLIAQALEFIVFDTQNTRRTFQLKTFVGYSVKLEHLQLVIQMCPLIQNLTLYKSKSSQNNLMALIGLHDLRVLKLAGYDFYSDQILELLQLRGHGLLDLHLQQVKQIDLNALMHISQMCPHLRSLTIDNCSFIEHTSLNTKQLEIQPFRNLKNVTWDTSSKQPLFLEEVSYTMPNFQYQSTIPNCKLALILELMSFLLTNCLNAEYVDFGRSLWLTEEIMLNILDKNPFPYLKEFKMYQFLSMPIIITPAVLDRIKRSCISPPEVLILLLKYYH